jgi:Tfp pilus assembly protein FimT
MVEIVVALGILTALAGIGWGTMQEYLPRFRLVRIAKHFRSELISMRQIAVQTNRETKFHLLAHSGGNCTDATQWGGAWEMSVGDQVMGSTKWDLLPEDTMEDGTDDHQGEAVVSFFDDGTHSGKDVCFQDWGRLMGPFTGNNQDSIVFSPRGWLRNPSSDFNAYGYMEFHFYNQEANRSGVFDAVKVQVSRAGMIRLLRVPKPHNFNPIGTSVTSSVR